MEAMTMGDAKAIIFPTDFSDLALDSWPWVQRLAAVLDAQVHCVYVVEPPVIYGTLGMEATVLPTAEELRENAKERLDEFTKKHASQISGGVIGKVLVGRPAESIVEYSDTVDSALIVMSTHGYSGLKHVVLGSTTESVLRHASCPVLSVPRR
jgi:nucleotide-binding universal stress UspA family protein